MHGELTSEEEALKRLKVFEVTYCHNRLIKVGNPSGQISHASIGDLECLADQLESESKTAGRSGFGTF